ncbi:unnamed protein product [Soboliphyme baturini]|uniref:RRM domain-containing protein n=1 Tax=Soboliphyme baturini TaxID=241478 RepID=A0A183J1S2_9BILA|nr:unnamed protein product [Soboliphyme baturini]
MFPVALFLIIAFNFSGISVQFDTEEAAVKANEQVKPLLLRLNRSNEKARRRSSKSEDVSQPEKWEVDDPDCFKKLYVSQLLPGTEEDLILAIFGKESLKSVKTFPDEKFSDGSRAAVLTFHSKELADQAKCEFDGFSVDDGETYSVIFPEIEADRLRREQQWLSGSKELNSTKNAVMLNGQRSSGEADSVQELRIPNSDSYRPFHHEAGSSDKLTVAGEGTISCIPSTSGPPVENDHTLLSSKKALGKAGNLWSAQIVENRSADQNDSPTTKSADGGGWKAKTNQPNSLPVVESSDSAPVPPPQRHNYGGSGSSQQQPTHHQAESVELSVSDIQRIIERIMERDRVNWAELSSAHDLWMIIHQTVQEMGWQPEETLKEAMMTTLHCALSKSEVDWLRNHLLALIRIWKKEIENKSRSKIRKQIQLADLDSTTEVPGASYVPPPENQLPEKRRKGHKRNLKQLMGVGAMLASVQKESSGVADSSGDRKRDEERRHSHRRQKESASESGEASSTSSDESESQEVAELAEASKTQQSQSSSQNSESSDDERQRKRRKARKRSKQGGGGDGIPKLSFGNLNPMAMQQWISQMMPAMIQVMPLMAQIMQMRMGTLSSMNPQQQQQMMQQLNQQVQQVNNVPSTAQSVNPPLHQQQAMAMNWMQRMMAPAAAPVPQNSGGMPYPSSFSAPPPPQALYSYNGVPPPSFPSPASGYSAH